MGAVTPLVTDFVGERFDEGKEHYHFKFDNGYVVSVRNVNETSLLESLLGKGIIPGREGQTWELALAFDKPSELFGIPIEVTPTRRGPFNPAAYAKDSAGVNALLTEVYGWEKVQ